MLNILRMAFQMFDKKLEENFAGQENSILLPSSAPSPGSNPTGAEISIIIGLSSHPHAPTHESIFQTQINLDLLSKVVGHNG